MTLDLDLVRGHGGNLYRGPTVQLPRFTRSRGAYGRQRSKRFEPPFEPSLQQPESFTRTQWHNDQPSRRRQRSRRFCPTFRRYHSPHLSAASFAFLGRHYVLNLPLVPSLVPICVNRSSLLMDIPNEHIADGELLLLGAMLSKSAPQPLDKPPSPCPPVRPSLSPIASVFVPNSRRLFPLSFDGIFPPRFHPSMRPNTNPRINRLPARSSHPTQVASKLNPDAWAYFLRDYPDRSFVDSLLYIINYYC
ncbi:hypothetical protein F5890DRAFT_1560440 [Lentinula detonsa]|uniref:Uncharacterized protein n=1 Tax=Lentinula detonsa TaxID=2804962 RepID=A0AA38UM50_9AGAR|nr:hypothetical protein F5890DRAFT_1560440 [Lentinula detonsa]